MRRSVLVCLGSCVLAGGCGSDVVDVAPLDEVCGVDGPVRLLELPPGRVLRESPLHVGDRVYYRVERIEPGDPGEGYLRTSDPEIWATGPCGESPVQVASGVSNLLSVARWPDVALGCTEDTGEIVSLDPTGAVAPHVVFTGLQSGSCRGRWTDLGLVAVETVDGLSGALVLHPYPDDPRRQTAVPVGLLDGIRLDSSGLFAPDAFLQTDDDSVLVVTDDDELVEIDLDDGTMVKEQGGVLTFLAAPDRRYLLWQSAVIASDPEPPQGEVYLRDREAGTDTLLAVGSLRDTWFALQFVEHGVVKLQLGDLWNGTERVFRLPDLDFVDLPAGKSLRARVDAERWILGVPFIGPRYELFDLQQGTRTPLFDRDATMIALDETRAEMLELGPCCVDEAARQEEGPLWSVPLDGGEPTLLAARVGRTGWRLESGRRITALDIDTQSKGALVLVDPDTQAELRIDDHVFTRDYYPWSGEPDTIVYSVDDGARSGVWRVRVAGE